MKNNCLHFLAAAAISGGMLVAAQETAGQPAQPPAPQQYHHRAGARLANYLNMSPQQRAGAKAEFQAAREAAQPLRAQLKQVRQAMFQAVRANDNARIDQLSAQEAGLKGQMSALRQHAFARVYQTLTPEQRAKADQLPAHFRQMRQMRQTRQSNS